MSKVVIIGGGVSGIISAITLKRNNLSNDVIVLERNSSCLKKLLLTGNGKCNYYNENQNINHYHSNNIELLNKIINNDNLNKVLEFWDSIGIIPKIKNGYYYPATSMAVSMKSALLCEVNNLGINIICDSLVINIRKNNESFEVITENETYVADKVIISTGGKSASKTGSDGLGYELAKNFNHTINNPFPSLVQLIGNESYYKEWSGIRCDVELSLYENNNFIKKESGEIQLTDSGISGIVTYNLSGHVSKNLSKNDEIIKINFVPFLNINNLDELVKYIDERNIKLPNRTIDELFDGIINYKLIILFIKLSNIQNKKYWHELSEIEKNKLCDYLINFKFIPVGTKGFDFSQVTCGGVSLKELNLNNFESTLVDNLYFIGEIVDIDGDCGGYNLTFAAISGLLAGEDNND